MRDANPEGSNPGSRISPFLFCEKIKPSTVKKKATWGKRKHFGAEKSAKTGRRKKPARRPRSRMWPAPLENAAWCRGSMLWHGGIKSLSLHSIIISFSPCRLSYLLRSSLLKYSLPFPILRQRCARKYFEIQMIRHFAYTQSLSSLPPAD